MKVTNTLAHVASLDINPAALEHRFVREAKIVTKVFSDEPDRREKIIGTENNKQCAIYGWAPNVARHCDETGYVYLMPLIEHGGEICTPDTHVKIRAGDVIRLNDFDEHWTVNDGPTVALFAGSWREPADDEAVAILAMGLAELVSGAYYGAPRMRKGFQVMAPDECWAAEWCADECNLMLLADAEKMDLDIQRCGLPDCNDLAVLIDHHFPYHRDLNRCIKGFAHKK